MPRKKKNYNPFKMWGSYVGASIGILTDYLYSNSELILGSFKLSAVYFSIELAFSLVIGFLVGWAIHSLFRWLK